MATAPARPQEALALAKDSKAKLLVLITSDAPGGVKWCGDCSEADPVIDAVIEECVDPVVLVKAPCKRSEYKGNPEFPFRKHAQLRITAIPTLFRWSEAGAGNKLVESEAKSKGHVELLLEDD